MKLIITLWLFIFNIFGAEEIQAFPAVEGTSYIVMNRTTHEVLAGSNYHLSRSVASISKTMTALIALESQKIFDLVTIDHTAVQQEGSSLYLKEYSEISLLDLVYGLMLRSGNDAAYAIGNYLGNEETSFVQMMNNKAAQIGMKDTVFNNPSGLDIDDAGNISSAYDMALLFSTAMENPIFKAITQADNYRTANGTTWYNKNKLLKMYDKCDGGKTGYTTKAKRTLVSGATDGDLSLCTVTLNCGNDFLTHKELCEYFFSKYTFLVFLQKGNNYIGSYVVQSPDTVGIMAEKNTVNNKCFKVYRFDEDGNLCRISFVMADGSCREMAFK